LPKKCLKNSDNLPAVFAAQRAGDYMFTSLVLAYRKGHGLVTEA